MNTEYYKELVESELKKALTEDCVADKNIYDAMAYSLFAGGKRIRPVIMLLTNEMLGGNIEYVLPFACAIEMIHTYSLIHDDLPAMDNDDLRRGRPTNHKVFGEAMAILAGDGLLNLAFETVSRPCKADSAHVLRAIYELSHSSGADGMIGGQVIDINSEGKDIDLETLKKLHRHKTCDLIIAAGAVGAIMAGADDEQINAVKSFCYNLGMAFQICDDILDVVGNEEVLGKNIGSDENNNKTTFVTKFTLEEASMLAKEYSDNAINALSCFGDKADKLIALCNYLLKRDR